MEEEVREESVPLDQDSGGQREPDGGDDRSGGEEFLHEFGKGWCRDLNQRGETVTVLSSSSSFPLVLSLIHI